MTEKAAAYGFTVNLKRLLVMFMNKIGILYPYSNEQPPTVTRLCTVARLVLSQTLAECPLK